jgi:hypothetical protein
MPPVSPWGAAWALFKKFWFVLPIAGLAFAVLWLRADVADAKADRDKAQAEAALLKTVNEQNAKVMEGYLEQRLANDAIVGQLVGAMQGNAERETNVRIEVEKEARNEPAVRDWLNQPIPNGLRRIIEQPPR